MIDKIGIRLMGFMEYFNEIHNYNNIIEICKINNTNTPPTRILLQLWVDGKLKSRLEIRFSTIASYVMKSGSNIGSAASGSARPVPTPPNFLVRIL